MSTDTPKGSDYALGRDMWFQHPMVMSSAHSPWDPLHVSYGTIDLTGLFHTSYRSIASRTWTSSADSQMVPYGSASSSAYDSRNLTDTVMTADTDMTDDSIQLPIGNTTWYRPLMTASPRSGSPSKAQDMMDCEYQAADPRSDPPSKAQDIMDCEYPTVGTRSDLSFEAQPSIECEYPGCLQRFRGHHRFGTMHRHMRLKHRGHDVERSFPCQAPGCAKSFKRQDARLKHHRRNHPELMVAAATPRKERQTL